MRHVEKQDDIPSKERKSPVVTYIQIIERVLRINKKTSLFTNHPT